MPTEENKSEWWNSLPERQDDESQLNESNINDPLMGGYENETKLSENVPDYQNYQWFKNPEPQYAYTLGEKLNTALNNGNSNEIENVIENNPVEAAEALPENSPLQKEAEEVVDGDKRTDEVDNEVIEDSIKDYHTPGGFLNQNQNGKLTDDDAFNELLSSIKEPSQQEKDEQAYRDQLNAEQLKDENYNKWGLDSEEYEQYHITPEEGYTSGFTWKPGTFLRKDEVGEYARNLIHNYPRSRVEAVLELLGRINNNEIQEFDAMLDANPWLDDDLYDILSHLNDGGNQAAPVVSRSLRRDKLQQSRKNKLRQNLTNSIKTSPNKVEPIEQFVGQEMPEDIKADVEKESKFVSEIDWDNVKVYKPGEEMYPGEYNNDWENEPDFDTTEWSADMGENPLPEGERPNFHEGDEAIDKMHERMTHDEDFAGPDELPATYEQIVEPGKELALTNGNQLAPVENAENAGFSWEVIDDQIDDAVDNDETIPEEEKEKTKKRRHRIIKWLSGNSKSITGGSNVPSEKTDISTKQQSSNIQSAGKGILGNVGASSGITSSKIPSVKEEKKPAAGSTASRAGGGSMPVANEGNYAAVSHSNGGSMSSGSAGSGMFGKVGTLGKGGAITSKKANLPSGESKGGSSVLQSPQGVKNSSMDMNVLSLKDKIIAKSKTWPGQKLDKDGLLIVVRDDNRVFINRQLLENFIKDNPKSVQQLRQIVDKY